MNIDSIKKILVKIFSVIYILIILFLLFIFPIPWLVGIPIHNYYLYKLDKRFNTIQHPPKSELIEKVSEVGLFGNSNHCDYAIGEFRRSSLSKKDIEEFYKNKTIGSLSQGPISLEVYFIDDINLDYFINGPFLEKLNHWITTTKSLNSNDYLILFVDPMNPPTGDYRCD